MVTGRVQVGLPEPRVSSSRKREVRRARVPAGRLAQFFLNSRSHVSQLAMGRRVRTVRPRPMA